VGRIEVRMGDEKNMDAGLKASALFGGEEEKGEV